MICPRCSKPTLDERERIGVTIDVCSECRGIWLDRGELERIIAMEAREMERYAPAPEVRNDHHGHHEHHDRHDSEHSRHGHHGHDHGHHRKRHWLAEIFD